MSSNQTPAPSDAELVREFTEGSQTECPTPPQPMNREEVGFIIGMVLSEMLELAQTITKTDEEAVQFLHDRVKTDLSHHERQDNPIHKTANQADAAVDAIYYLYNCFGKKGVNLSKVFGVVHAANMAKRDPTTGKFVKRESDGKVLKPPNWQPPDIHAEIQRQILEGSWDRKII